MDNIQQNESEIKYILEDFSWKKFNIDGLSQTCMWRGY